MVLKNDQVVKHFMDKKRGEGTNIYTDGTVIYSYGEHYPLAVWVGDNALVINTDRVSTTTSTHLHALLRECATIDGLFIVEAKGELVRKIIRGEDVRVDMSRIPETMTDALYELKDLLKKEGVSSMVAGRFIQEVRNKIKKLMLVEML